MEKARDSHHMPFPVFIKLVVKLYETFIQLNFVNEL